MTEYKILLPDLDMNNIEILNRSVFVSERNMEDFAADMNSKRPGLSELVATLALACGPRGSEIEVLAGGAMLSLLYILNHEFIKMQDIVALKKLDSPENR